MKTRSWLFTLVLAFGLAGPVHADWRPVRGPLLTRGKTLDVVHHDEDVEIYLNGVLAAKAPGFTIDYEELPIIAEALATLKPGKKKLAVHCKQTTGGQYIDVGIADVK